MTFNEQSHTPLAGRVLERIDGERVTPRPRWEFMLENYFFWIVGAIAVLFGAVAFSATLFQIMNVDWRLSVVTHPNFLSFFLEAAPFLWVSVLALFILIGYLNIRRTKHGYRYPLSVIALGAVLTSLTLGSGLYACGFGSFLEETIGDHPPFFRPILVEERSWWLAPEQGLLGGEVIEAESDISSFVLRDFSGHLWRVDGNDLSGSGLSVIARGGTVRIVGLPISSTSTMFHACFVFPWETFGTRRGILPPPVAIIASTSALRAEASRSETCASIRPYKQLRVLDISGR